MTAYNGTLIIPSHCSLNILSSVRSAVFLPRRNGRVVPFNGNHIEPSFFFLSFYTYTLSSFCKIFSFFRFSFFFIFVAFYVCFFLSYLSCIFFFLSFCHFPCLFFPFSYCLSFFLSFFFIFVFVLSSFLFPLSSLFSFLLSCILKILAALVLKFYAKFRLSFGVS